MRLIYLLLVALISAVILVFMFQNLSTVRVAFLAYSLTLPVSLLVIVVYVLGMFTGGAVVSLIKSWIRGSARPHPNDRQ
jgi:lipopolysaccharide assembly protein A